MRRTQSFRRWIPLLGMLATLMAAPLTRADTITGKLNGVECATRGEECPTDKNDPHLAIEPDFVVHTITGEYFFLPNLNRATKYRYVLETVRVEGRKNPRFPAIHATELWIKTDGNQWRRVWSEAQEDAERRLLRDYKN